jgi:sugar phosphate isomerase/epimerase
MNYKRRKFMQMAGVAATGSLILPQWACKSGGEQAAGAAEVTEAIAKPSLSQFGLQLYTLRDDMPKDPKGILKQVASFGYAQIEGYEHAEMGMFWGMDHLQFKAYLDELGLNMVSSHCAVATDFETKAAQAAEIGMKYLICPWIGPQKSMDAWKKVADDFNGYGEICRKNGIRFAYHNHGYSFQEMDGVIPQNYLMDNTDPATVDYEFDLYWVITGGADPVTYLEKYGDRIPLCHVKDRTKGAPEGEADASCIVGTGSIDFASLLGIAAKNGMEYYILEQEKYENSTPLKSAEAGAAYLKQLVFT